MEVELPAVAHLPEGLRELVEESKKEYERVQRELKEIDVLLRQSTGEVERLAQQNAQLTNRLRQMEAHLESLPRTDIKEMYSAAQEVQMRLFMMKGQVEQLQSRRQNLERYARQLRKFLDFAEGAPLAETAVERGEGYVDHSVIVRVIEAQERERQHLARRMHDGPAQALTNLILQAEICERLFDMDPSRARAELVNLKNAVNATFQQIRGFIFELRPMMLDDLGLIPTLRRYVKDFADKSGLSVNLTITGKERRLPSHIEVTLFRIIQELLNNVGQHAHASRVQISLDIQDRLVRASVEDDGSGFDVDAVLASARERKGLGISAMQEQVEMLRGKIHFESGIGRGTKVTLEIPLS